MGTLSKKFKQASEAVTTGQYKQRKASLYPLNNVQS
jgi:hypothetical protein